MRRLSNGQEPFKLAQKQGTRQRVNDSDERKSRLARPNPPDSRNRIWSERGQRTKPTLEAVSVSRHRPPPRFRCPSRPEIDESQEIKCRQQMGGSCVALLGQTRGRSDQPPCSMRPNRDEAPAKPEACDGTPEQRMSPQSSWTGPRLTK
jgi:hypothetical protein